MAWDGHVWAAGPGGLWKGDGTVWTRVLDRPVAGLCPHNDRMVAVSEASLFEIDGDTAACISEKGAPGVLGVASYAGALYAHYMGFINPTPFSAEASLNAILAVILGGSGTLTGPLLGGALAALLPEVLRLAEVYRLIAYGFILILVVIFLPRGLVPALTGLAVRLRGRGQGG